MPFCIVCKNAGKSETAYTSHFVRQTPHKLSPVTCPTILNNHCNHCGCVGHFISDCPLAKEERKIQKSENVRKRKLQAIREDPPSQSVRKVTNMFNLLDDDEDDVVEEINELPVLPTNDVFVTKRRGVISSWSALMDSDSDEE